jgi:hypothetical protein
VLSPVLFSVQLDGLLTRLAAHAAGNPVGYPTAGDTVFTNITFADDIDMVADSASAAQTSLDIVVDWMAEHGMRLNLKAGKSEVVMIGPVSRRQPVFINQEAMRFVDMYKLLGRLFSSMGPSASYRLMLDKATSSARAALGRASASGIRDARVSEGRVYILTHIRVGATYALGVWGVDAPRQRFHAIGDSALHLIDRKACATVLRMDRAQWPAVQSLLGVVALPTEFVKSVLRILFDILRHPRSHHLRAVLKRGKRSKDAWWWAARGVLLELDRLELSESGSTVYKPTGIQWLLAVEMLIDEVEVNEERERDTLLNLTSRVDFVVEWLDWELLQQAVAKMPSLAHTKDLLADESVTLGLLYFLRLDRTRANVYRCHLRGGIHCLFSYKHYHDKCPFCKLVTATVPHLLMECPSLSRRRHDLQVRLRQIASTPDGVWILMGANEPLQHIESRCDVNGSETWTAAQRAIAVHWYLLIVGAAVPSSFLRTTLFTMRDRNQLHPAAWAERDAHLRIYTKLLNESGNFIVWVFHHVAVLWGATKYIHNTDLLQERREHQRQY